MTKNQSIASLVLRVAFGGMMLTHGYGKFINLISGNHGFPDPFGIGALPSLLFTVFGEFVCPILLILGYKTKLASIPPSVVMLVAAFMIHWSDPWSKKEFPLLYLAGYIAIYFLGAGKYSLDFRLKKI